MELDAFDRKILTLLQKDSRMPQRDISDAVHLSASAVNRRIAAMEAAGRHHSATRRIVDPAKVGRPDHHHRRGDRRERAARPARCGQAPLLACPEVQQLYYVTGEVDLVIILNVADMAEYQQLTRQLFFAEANVKSFRTMVAMERSKVSLAVYGGVRRVPQ